MHPSAILAQITQALDEFTGLETVWPHGLIRPGGPHYRLRGTAGPSSLGADECLALGRLALEFQPARTFILGNGFGLSAAFLARLTSRFRGQVLTLDNQSEGDGARCFQAAAYLRDHLPCPNLYNHLGASPDAIPALAADGPFHLVLIDGAHHHPQVTIDFHAIRPHLHSAGIVIWHDYWLPGVVQSVATAQKEGWYCLRLPTSCEIVFGTRHAGTFATLSALYPTAGPPVPSHRYLLGRSRLAMAYLSARVTALIR